METTSFDHIALEVRRLVAETLRRPLDDVPLDASLAGQGLGLDSLALIKLNVALEEAFDVTMPDFDGPEAARVRSVRDVAELVAARVAHHRAGGAA